MMNRFASQCGRATIFRIAALVLCIAVMLPLSVCAAQEVSEEAVNTMVEEGVTLIEQRQFDAGLERLGQALPIAYDLKAGAIVARIYRWAGIARIAKGDLDAGYKDIDRAIAIYRRFEVHDLLGLTLQIAAGFSRKHGRRQAEIDYRLELAELQGKQGQFEKQADTLYRLLDIIDLASDPDLFERVLLTMRAACDRIGDAKCVADTWAGTGKVAQLKGNADLALEHYQEANRRYDAMGALGRKAAILNVVSELLRSEGRESQALPLQREAVAIRREHGSAVDLGQSLNNLALVYQEMGEIPNAVAAIEEALALTRSSGSKENLASTLVNAASIYRDAGRLEAGKAFLDEVFAMGKGGGLDDERKRAGQILATIYHLEGDPLKAAATAAVAENMGEDAPAQSGEADFKSHNMAVGLAKMGKYNKAIEIFKANLRKAKAEGNQPDAASSHEGLALAYTEADQYDDAEAHLLSALKIHEARNNSKDRARTLLNLASIHSRQGRFYDAMDRFNSTRALAEKLEMPVMQIEVLLSAAQLHRRLKNHTRALDLAQNAYALSVEKGLRQYQARALGLQGIVHLHRKDYTAAEKYFVHEAALTKDTSKPVINEGLVEVYLATGRYDEAKAMLDGVSDELLATATPGYQLQYYTKRGLAHLGNNATEKAIEDFSRAMSKSEDIRGGAMDPSAVGFFAAGTYGGRIRPYRGMLDALMGLVNDGIDATLTIGDRKLGLVPAALHYAELAHARNLSHKMATREFLRLRKKMPARIQQEETRLQERTKSLAAEVGQYLARGEAVPDRKRAEYEALVDALRDYYDRIRREYPRYAQLFKPTTIAMGGITLAEDEVLLEYALGLDAVYLFILRNGAPIRAIPLEITPEALETKISMFRALLVVKRYSAKLGIGLYNALLKKAQDSIRPKDTVTIVPAGPLGLLPFEALPTYITSDGKPGRFFGHRRQVRYAQSATVHALMRNARRSPAAKPFFGLGDPIFSAQDPRFSQLALSGGQATSPGYQRLTNRYARLPETQDEIKTLAGMFKVPARAPDVLIGPDANESRLRQTDLGAYRVLHFATHAEAVGEPGVINEPFLVLNQFSNGDADGYLTMSEIMGFDLNADLAILAACGTGQGDLFEGEGVASLANAFQYAGAASVVLSLWEVPSKATLAFMTQFYRHLESGASKTKALQMARDEMLKKYDQPYYWSMFILYGNE